MADKVKVTLLKKLYRDNAGDVIEVRSHEARALIALGTAENYVEKPVRTTTTRVMQPLKESEPAADTQDVTVTGTIGENQFGRYTRRDMQPEE
jgi:hypothetical protein